MIRNLLTHLGGSILSLRYRLHLKGLEHLKSQEGGYLFLPNHPSELDPALLISALPLKLKVRPLVVETFFSISWVRWILNLFGAISIPNFGEGGNQYKLKKTQKTFETLVNLLKSGENLLIYPSGKLKLSGLELIGGASGVYTILKNCRDAKIILVRTTGLWGSSFSTYFTGHTPNLNKQLLEGIKTLLLNGIFFAPRRDVTIEFSPAPEDFPFESSKIQLNQYLEGWYNQPYSGNGLKEGEKPLLVPQFFWLKELRIRQREQKSGEKLLEVPIEMRKSILEEVSRISKKPVSEINNQDVLSTDLGMDSLDTLELISFLNYEYEVQEMSQQDLLSVESVMQRAVKPDLQSVSSKNIEHPRIWPKEIRPPSKIPEGETIAEVFLTSCHRLKNLAACGDDLVGVLSYRKVKIAALLLADKISQHPGKHIGILLPASAGSMLMIVSTILANKVPVMMNWTLGPKHLQDVAKIADVKKILTSERFLSKAKNMDLEGVEDRLVFSEKIKGSISLWDKLKAFSLSLRSVKSLLEHLSLQNISTDDPAVILFTSGTESKPKGVPLSNKNILSNQKAALEAIRLTGDDILYGFLPPFHSFGFTVTGLMPILAGIRVAYYPDPTNGPQLAGAAGKWQVTIVCGAPTFIKTLLNCSKKGELNTARLFVSGAEKASKSIFNKVHELGKEMIEGYGITECGPMLSCNRPGILQKGVGQPFPGVELLVVDPETYAPLPTGVNGLILARGPNIFKGYLLGSQVSPFVEVDGKNWYKTGDLGALDEANYLVLSGRLKRFVKIGGEMINLNEVEEALRQLYQQNDLQNNGPSLAVCAIEKEGEKTSLILFTPCSLALNEVNQFLKVSGFSNLVKISEVRQLATLPLLGTGKINYRQLEEQLS